jgi:uncharacterized protein (DUF111 family)
VIALKGPTCCRLCSARLSGPHPDAQLLTIIETTVDDVTGEVLGAVIDYLLAGGALDAWAASVVGKKGRPAHVITALCAPDFAGLIEQRLLPETGSLGARHHSVVRHARAAVHRGSGVRASGTDQDRPASFETRT